MKTKWMWLLGAAIVAFAMGDVAHADHLRGYHGGYGYGSYGYAPSYGYGYSGYLNRTDHYHYTYPRVTTGYGFRSHYPSYGYGGYYGRGYGYGGGGVNVLSPRGAVNVGWGRYGGGVNVFGRWGGVSIGW